MAAKGVFALPVSVFDNGLRQIATRTKPIVRPDDLAGMKIRVPDGRMFHDVFSAPYGSAYTTRLSPTAGLCTKEPPVATMATYCLPSLP